VKDHVPVTKLIDHYDMEVSTLLNINLRPPSLKSETDRVVYVIQYLKFYIENNI